MKTQISNLVSGRIGVVGTSSAIRQEISKKVLEENGDNLHVAINGVELHLTISRSCSGKTWWWRAELTEEQYKAITNNNTLGVSTRINSYSLTISCECRCTADVAHRSNDRQQWKPGYTTHIDECNITIL